ncbi:hypothetical protein OHA18_20900 [Kribbella sp. NBC_00709]|uniref:DUF7144 family membrane protein n=1 Tax=Kribbella sp. NBC_00709 TaxID=2975972 RepID=UPI002E2D4CAD|nr:hypothetical protein [Kribbella sp. NBC_00709]
MPEPDESTTATHRRPGEVEVPEWPSRWVGWILFAGVMMIVLGMIHAFQGLVAIYDDTYFLVRTARLAVHLGYETWGWIHLAVALFVIVAGVALLNGRLWGRVIGVVLAVLSLLLNMAFLAAYPSWSTITIAVDVLIIWALTVHGHEMHQMLNANKRQP